MHLHHINIKAPWELIERERVFFCEVLGLKEGSRPSFPRRGYWLYEGDNAIVHLSESDSHSPTEKQGCFDHVAFQTSHLNAFVKRLIKRKIEHTIVYLDEIYMTQVFCSSPSGIRIEINFLNEKV